MTQPAAFAAIEDVTYPGASFLIRRTMGGSYYLQVLLPDNISGRKWLLSEHSTSSEVVQTALKALLTVLEHEAREQFRYRGRVIFGPHFDIDKLVALADAGSLSVRTDARSAKA